MGMNHKLKLFEGNSFFKYNLFLQIKLKANVTVFKKKLHEFPF
jgi:hypothetical protein